MSKETKIGTTNTFIIVFYTFKETLYNIGDYLYKCKVEIFQQIFNKSQRNLFEFVEVLSNKV